MPIEVVIADLCLETQFTIVQTQIEIELTVLGPSVTESFDKPISLLAVEMNKPAICGSVTYIVTLISGPSSSLTPTVDPGIPSVSAASTSSS